ncbi:class I SAM-dependent methyltransferase [Porticoccus sp.]
MKKKYDESYFLYLKRNQEVWWKSFFGLRIPYILFLKFHDLGKTLEVGCGSGRNLRHLKRGSIGVDVIEECVSYCKGRGLNAVLYSDLSEPAESFDSILFSHVIEHLSLSEAVNLVKEYVGYLKPGGKLLVIVPQLKGYLSDETHVEFYGAEKLGDLCRRAGLLRIRSGSYPFPKGFGKYFKYNETYILARKP